MDSPCESESSLDGGVMLPPSPVSREQLQKRIESLTQQNKVLKVELETYKIRVKVIQEENRALRQASVIIQAKAEQEEEYISNTLLKKIQALKKEKETLAHHYEREEECLTNDLSRKLDQLRQEKCKLELTLEQEQECLVNKLMRKIEKLEAETSAKQSHLEQLRREMVELENTLEQEQEALVNKLWKRMDKLEAEKRSLQIKLDQPVSDPTSPKEINHRNENGNDTASQLTAHIQNLRSEVDQLRGNLAAAEKESKEKSQQFAQEEKCIRDENKRLQRKLQQEVERREALSRHLSESESSLEFEEERLFNENVSAFGGSSGSIRPISPGGLSRCHACGQLVSRRTSERFIKPAIPLGLNTSAPNVLHHHHHSSIGAPSAPGGSGASFSMISSSTGASAAGAGGNNINASFNSSISSSSIHNTSSNISCSGNSSFVQPASPMDTSMSKD
ncbi:coiled-coil domain-containing protein 6 [Toxorhynchites rutilus septentrionalis]|uniref:coiled-coil domain-containing protein 6 n=1 Tax=Toxorhynchites rutilus septentrionalis TaxID=329112 RepID=UPI00247AB40B|nr:coiled-coil domain-containing protein 6 [Toxorhynchites rutilus septentrionalis]XP_055620212.1 coiled-coil domain-containing protein 6 [Toxorhynchites rutilus septentrionalis]